MKKTIMKVRIDEKKTKPWLQALIILLIPVGIIFFAFQAAKITKFLHDLIMFLEGR